MQFTTAGEADGPALFALVNDVPAGLRLELAQAESDLARCQGGYGYSQDTAPLQYVEISSGVRHGRTTGAPVTFLLYGDQATGTDRRDPRAHVGSGDIDAYLQTAADDIADPYSRISSFDQAVCVAAASVPREFLAEVGVDIHSFVSTIGSVSLAEKDPLDAALHYDSMSVEFSPVRCPVEHVSKNMVAEIEKARSAGVTLGGIFRVVVTGLLPGLGGFAQKSQSLNAQLAAALFSLPQVVGVEFGAGFGGAAQGAADTYDALCIGAEGFTRTTNHAGGTEGGLSTGMPLVITVAVCAPYGAADAPASLDLDVLQPVRSPELDIPSPCVVPGVAVAAEAQVAFVLARVYTHQFGCANMTDIRAALNAYAHRIQMAAR